MKIRLIKMLLIIISIVIDKNVKAQTEIQGNSKKYSEIFDSLATGLIPNRIPFGNLNDRTAGWGGLAEWQNNDTVSTTQIIQSWYDAEQIYLFQKKFMQGNLILELPTKMV